MVYVMHMTATKVIESALTFAQPHVLHAITAGEHLTTLAFSEQGSRSHFWAPLSRLDRHGQAYQTHAVKSWVTAAHYADSFSRHLGVERFFQDARAGWVMAPTVDHLPDFLGRALTGLPLLGA
jgi:alkylation response protein AidB-like acyl-CoA dehydrogenase